MVDPDYFSLNTAVKELFPQPCTNVPEIGNEAAQAEKILSEFTEAKEAFDHEQSLDCTVPPSERVAARSHTNEEIADVITACITWLNMRGLDQYDRIRLYRSINDKNKARNYL